MQYFFRPENCGYRTVCGRKLVAVRLASGQVVSTDKSLSEAHTPVQNAEILNSGLYFILFKDYTYLRIFCQ